MYVIMGVGVPHYPKEEDGYEVEVALFDLKEDAEKYIENSKLKGYTSVCNLNKHNQFRAKSLLKDYCHAYVREWKRKNLPHNPVI